MLRLRAALADENCGPRDLAPIAAGDPVLAGALMRIGNSPVLYQRGQARTLVDIISRLGAQKTFAVAVSTALHARIKGVPARVVDTIWSRSVEVARVALDVALRAHRRDLADDAYLAGLVHHAGVCVLLRRFPEHGALLDDTEGAGHEAAVARLDAATDSDHAAIGYLVARNWKLSARVCESVRHHHLPDAPPSDEVATLGALIAVGRRALDGPNPDWELWAPVAKRCLDLDDSTLTSLSGSA